MRLVNLPIIPEFRLFATLLRWYVSYFSVDNTRGQPEAGPRGTPFSNRRQYSQRHSISRGTASSEVERIFRVLRVSARTAYRKSSG